MGGLDIPLSLFEASAAPDRLVCHVATSPLRVVRAMAQHRSQWVWCVMVSCRDGLSCRQDKRSQLLKRQARCPVTIVPHRRFRKLFMAFSRYTYVNTLQRIDS